MKLIFVIGPYRATTEWGVHENIAKAEAVALQLWRLGFSVICPHKNTAWFGGACPDEVWLEGDKEQLRRCDAAFCVEGSENSRGAQGEIALAKSRGIPLFHSFEEIDAWRRRTHSPN